MNNLNVQTSIIIAVGVICITAAYVLGPHEYRDEILATVGGLVSLAAGAAPQLIKRRSEDANRNGDGGDGSDGVRGGA